MSSAIDIAVISKLYGSPALTAAAPGGVHFDVAPAGVKDPFVLVNLQAHSDEYTQGGRMEIGRYWIRAVGQGTNSPAVANVAALIHAALQDQPIIVTGYAPMTCHREERQRFIEIDGGIRWQHMGGIYAVWESKT
jgi:hypothetical protein